MFYLIAFIKRNKITQGKNTLIGNIIQFMLDVLVDNLIKRQKHNNKPTKSK